MPSVAALSRRRTTLRRSVMLSGLLSVLLAPSSALADQSVPAPTPTEMVFVGTVVGADEVMDPTITLVDSVTGEGLGSAPTDEAGTFNVTVPTGVLTEVESLGATVSGRTTEGQPVTVNGASASRDHGVDPDQAVEDSLLVVVSSARAPRAKPVATVVLSSEAATLLPGQTWTDEQSPHTATVEREAEIQDPRAQREPHLSLACAGASSTVIIGAGFLTVAALASVMVVAGRRRRN